MLKKLFIIITLTMLAPHAIASEQDKKTACNYKAASPKASNLAANYENSAIKLIRNKTKINRRNLCSSILPN